jgi:Rab-GTPase-TBC domain
LKFYRKCPLEFELPSKIEQRITQALSKPFPEILSGLYSPNPIKKLLRMFAYKQPNISFVFGMHYIAAILINIFIVETDAFIMLCHILENLYPPVILK